MLPIAQTFPFAVTSTDVVLIDGPALLFGWAVIETSGGAPATFDVLDGNVTALGVLVAPIALSQGESTRDFSGPSPIMCGRGITIGNVAGAIRGAIWATPAHRDDDNLIELYGLRI